MKNIKEGLPDIGGITPKATLIKFEPKELGI